MPRRIVYSEKHRKIHALLILLANGFVVLVLLACTQPVQVSVIGPDGMLRILGPSKTFEDDLSNGVWLKLGNVSPGHLSITNDKGIQALRIQSDETDFALLKPLEARLLATPFLEWSWKAEQHAGEFHSTGLLVGFLSPGDNPDVYQPDLLNDLPELVSANRILEIRWSQSALKRGHLHVTSEDYPVPVYIVRGGEENTGRWWRDGVELSNLYQRLWPQEDLSRIQITFVAILSDDTKLPVKMSLTRIDLFR